MNKKDFLDKMFITNGSEETQKLGRDFAKVLGKGDIVCLYGTLGSGKTTFVQGLAQGLGIKRRIVSPTFIIVRNYRITNYDLRFKNFYHIDLYRIENKEDVEGLALEEILNDIQNIVVVEWAERLRTLMPAKRIDVKFSFDPQVGGENARKIAFNLGL